MTAQAGEGREGVRSAVMTEGGDLPAPIAGLIGLGPGLTPLRGRFPGGRACAARRARGKACACRTGAGDHRFPRGSTSALSECLLKTAAAGHFGEDLCRAVSAVITGMPDQAAAAIRKIGHSSGWDMLAGILTALHAVATASRGLSARVGGRSVITDGEKAGRPTPR